MRRDVNAVVGNSLCGVPFAFHLQRGTPARALVRPMGYEYRILQSAYRLPAPFRQGGLLARKWIVVCVGDGFIRSECGMHKCIPYDDGGATLWDDVAEKESYRRA